MSIQFKALSLSSEGNPATCQFSDDVLSAQAAITGFNLDFGDHSPSGMTLEAQIKNCEINRNQVSVSGVIQATDAQGAVVKGTLQIVVIAELVDN